MRSFGVEPRQSSRPGFQSRSGARAPDTASLVSSGPYGPTYDFRSLDFEAPVRDDCLGSTRVNSSFQHRWRGFRAWRFFASLGWRRRSCGAAFCGRPARPQKAFAICLRWVWHLCKVKEFSRYDGSDLAVLCANRCLTLMWEAGKRFADEPTARRRGALISLEPGRCALQRVTVWR